MKTKAIISLLVLTSLVSFSSCTDEKDKKTEKKQTISVTSAESQEAAAESAVSESTSEGVPPVSAPPSQTEQGSEPPTTPSAQSTASVPKTSTASASPPSAVAVIGVALSQTAVTLEIGGTTTLTATVSPGNASNKAVSWVSSNTGIASVDGNGKISAKATGTATITVKTHNGKTAACTVTVNAPQKPFDINEWVIFARKYGESIGLIFDSGTTGSWDTPITASPASIYLERDITNRLNRYKNNDGFTYFSVWSEKRPDGKYEIYIGYG